MSETSKIQSEPEIVAEIIKEVGVSRLGYWDGCCCSQFSIRNVNVSIACGKSSREQGVWIWSYSDDYPEEEQGTLLGPAMNEIVKQLEENSNRGGKFAQHFEEWKN